MTDEKQDRNLLSYQVFALCMKEDGAVDHFRNNLPMEVVASEGKGHGDFYRAILHFVDRTGATQVDPPIFRSWLQNETLLFDALGGEDGLNAYVEEIEKQELPQAQTLVGLMKYRYGRKQQSQCAQELDDLLEDPRTLSEENSERIDYLVARIRDLNQGIVDPLATIYDGERMAADAESLWNLPDFLPTQFRSLNSALGYDEEKGGFMKESVNSILAASGLGKSTLARTFTLNWLEDGHRVLYINYEEARPHWERILFTQITKQNVYKGDGLTATEKKHFTQIFKDKMKTWGDRLLVKHDPETPYYEDMEAWVREVAYKHGAPDVLVIDTIQSMFLKSGSGLPRWGQYEQMMVRLEKLAKDIHCVIIITAQENSNRMKEKREVVQQSDIGGSLAIAQKSSVTIFITEAKLATGDDSQDERIMQLQIPKNRITGTTYKMNPPMVRYNDDHKIYEEYEPVDGGAYSTNEVDFPEDGGFLG
ncbi:MAG: AAA family ATPase [Actinobacteria bacterium]|nr:AAA family ATPase [Actinomycetota bacterium]